VAGSEWIRHDTHYLFPGARSRDGRAPGGHRRPAAGPVRARGRHRL